MMRGRSGLLITRIQKGHLFLTGHFYTKGWGKESTLPMAKGRPPNCSYDIFKFSEDFLKGKRSRKSLIKAFEFFFLFFL